jgi:hypothetical protein
MLNMLDPVRPTKQATVPHCTTLQLSKLKAAQQSSSLSAGCAAAAVPASSLHTVLSSKHRQLAIKQLRHLTLTLMRSSAATSSAATCSTS